jgi:hypothetical protein
MFIFPTRAPAVAAAARDGNMNKSWMSARCAQFCVVIFPPDRPTFVHMMLRVGGWPPVHPRFVHIPNARSGSGCGCRCARWEYEQILDEPVATRNIM